MIPNLEMGAASALIGVAAFEVWKAWNNSAPSISEMRTAEPDDISTRQKLLDAEITVGALVLIVGGTYAGVTRNLSPLLIMVVVLGALAFFHHWILEAQPN